MNWDTLESAARTRGLTALGGFHPSPDDDLPAHCKTLVLLGPDEPLFWPHFIQSGEYNDGLADPMDRWSRRVVTELANALDADALFPFGGAPFLPFFSWATRTGRIHASPVNFLVHDTAGLFVSFRGALVLSNKLEVPQAPAKPCDACDTKPCITACPVSALTPAGYDVAACKVYLDTPAGRECVTQGCAVRRSCPVSQRFGRVAAQSEYHMRHFKGEPR